MALSKGPREYQVSVHTMKRLVVEALRADSRSKGETPKPIGFVNLKVTFDSKTDRVIGFRFYVSKEIENDDDPALAYEIRPQRESKNGK